MFAMYFSNQCKVIVSNSILPNLTYFTNDGLDNITFTDGNKQMIPLSTKNEINKLLKIIGLYLYYQFVVNCLRKLYLNIFTIF